MKEQVKDWVISLIGLTAGSILAAAALENFLIPFKILDGGLNGIGMIINFLTDLPLSVLIVVLNIPFFVVGLIQLGKGFIVKYAYAIVVFSVFLEYFKDVSNATQDSAGDGVRRRGTGNRRRSSDPIRGLYRRYGDGGDPHQPEDISVCRTDYPVF